MRKALLTIVALAGLILVAGCHRPYFPPEYEAVVLQRIDELGVIEEMATSDEPCGFYADTLKIQKNFLQELLDASR